MWMNANFCQCAMGRRVEIPLGPSFATVNMASRAPMIQLPGHSQAAWTIMNAICQGSLARVLVISDHFPARMWADPAETHQGASSARAHLVSMVQAMQMLTAAQI
jgi:hypothetical protein